jgi:type IV pilus assembly protein PilV
MKVPMPNTRAGRQSGVMLIEALIALLIFSVGVLGIVGLQSTAAKVSGDARYRSEAALLANELIGRMWSGDRTPDVLRAQYDNTVDPNAPGFQAWAWSGYWATPGTKTAPAQNTVLKMLPGASANLPVVTVTPVTRTVTGAGGVVTITTAQVSITVKWQAPQEDGESSVHSYVAVAHIGG